MGWRTRRVRQYYYRSLRVDGRHQTVYVGGGAIGQRAAQEDADMLQQKLTQRRTALDLRQEFDSLESIDTRFQVWTNLLLKARLVTFGYYNNCRTWRPRKHHASV